MHPALTIAAVASMRPRRFSPRKAAICMTVTAAKNRFNEAAAFFAAEGRSPTRSRSAAGRLQ